MDENREVHGRRKGRRRSAGRHPHTYPYELRRKAVQLCLEEGFPVGRTGRGKVRRCHTPFLGICIPDGGPEEMRVVTKTRADIR